MLFSSILLAAIGVAYAAPQGQPQGQTQGQPQGQPHALYVEGMSPGSVADMRHASPLGLPGFDHLMRNKTVPVPILVPMSEGDYFDGRCLQVTLSGHGRVGQTMLEGRCVDDEGQWWQTSLSLNECIGNDAGKLVYRDVGNFDGSCRPCTLDNAPDRSDLVLKCNCLDDGRMPRYTFLEMGPNVQDSLAVKPVDGRFICGNHVGSKSPSL